MSLRIENHGNHYSANNKITIAVGRRNLFGSLM